MITSYELVKSLEKRKIWQEYMTKNECRILKDALKSSDAFTNFMNQKGSTPMNSNYLTMLHTQQMISEQLLSELYKDIPKCPIDKEPNPTIQAMKSLFKPVIDDDDDNYDFDEEETKVDIKEEKIESKVDKEEDKENERNLILDDMYYTVDYDEEAEIEYNNKKLDKEAQKEEEEEEKPKIQKSPFRTHAIKMRAKANSLMKLVPDVTIKIKGDSDSEDDASHLNLKDNLQSSQNGTDSMKVDKSSNADGSNKAQEEAISDEVEKALFEKGEDVKTEKWKEDSLDLRATKYIEMENEFKKPFNDRKTIVRDPLKMQKYYNEEKEYLERIKNYFKSNKDINSVNELSTSHNNLNDTNTDNKNKSKNIPSSSSNNKKNPNNTSKSFYPEYSHFSSSIPAIAQIPFDIGTKIIPSNEFDKESIDIPTLFEYDEIRQDKNDNTLASIVCNNIIELRTIQALFYKIQAKQIGNEVPPTSVIPNLFEESERKFIPESLPPLTMNERTVAQKEALEITIDVVIQYLHNIGHSLKLYIDQFSKDTDFLTILEKVLEINQCNPKSLFYHMKTGIQRFSVKLVDLRKKLDYTYKDLCSPQRNQSMYDDDGFMDDDDAFISGNFGEDLGIDFFGFKQMGIDISNVIYYRNQLFVPVIKINNY
ncbi:hypothetical protein PIROE2DRAFT_60578 [Piromyces sp. E2]|nr:hypothetical protein PIROE2DRAFT_60578 [Piromyces sp. E2]|eukprot:OUM64566.1 hypothetical protein PIROE2DRAFT_60578 [Piromyces sp. E2]